MFPRYVFVMYQTFLERKSGWVDESTNVGLSPRTQQFVSNIKTNVNVEFIYIKLSNRHTLFRPNHDVLLNLTLPQYNLPNYFSFVAI